MFGTESTGSLNTAAGQHHRVNGTFNLYLFNNLTSSSSNNPQTPPLLDNLNTTTSPMNVSGNDGRNLVVVGVLIGLIVLLCLFLALVAAPPLYAIWRSSIPVNPQKIERRYRTIEGWLISKTIKEHDDHCDNVRRAYTENTEQEQQQQHRQQIEPAFEPPPLEECQSTDETVDSSGSLPCCGIEHACETPESKEEDRKQADAIAPTSSLEEHECAICMEPFVVGQTVSWSASTSCEHVFHHSCIKEWLLRHIHCPCCREVYLLVDCPEKKKLALADLQKLALERKKRYDQTYFCVQDGLITLHGLPTSPSNDSSGNRDEMWRTIKSKTKSGVSKTLLAAMRSTPAVAGESSAPPSPMSTSLAGQTQQQSSSPSSSPLNSTRRVAPSQQETLAGQCDLPFDERGTLDGAAPPTYSACSETESSLRPPRSSFNTPIVSTKSSQTNNSIWREVNDEKTAPPALLPLSSSLSDDFDVEAGKHMTLVTQTDSFKENQAESSKVKQNAITLIMGTSMGQIRHSDSAKTKVTTTQPFLSENYQNV